MQHKVWEAMQAASADVMKDARQEAVRHGSISDRDWFAQENVIFTRSSHPNSLIEYMVARDGTLRILDNGVIVQDPGLASYLELSSGDIDYFRERLTEILKDLPREA